MDSANLYKVLTQDVIPLFFQRDAQGIPRQWIQRIRRAVDARAAIYDRAHGAGIYREVLPAQDVARPLRPVGRRPSRGGRSEGKIGSLPGRLCATLSGC